MILPSLHALLRDLIRAQSDRNVLSSMITISQTIRNHLDDAWMEFEQIEDALYFATKENEELVKRLTAHKDISV